MNYLSEKVNQARRELTTTMEWLKTEPWRRIPESFQNLFPLQYINILKKFTVRDDRFYQYFEYLDELVRTNKIYIVRQVSDDCSYEEKYFFPLDDIFDFTNDFRDISMAFGLKLDI